MGRHAKPPKLKLVTGNPGKRAIAAAPKSRVVDASTKPPAHLSPMACEIWREKIAQLVADKFLAVSDLDTLARYCEAVSTERMATTQLETAGYVIETKQGCYPSPWVKIRSDAAARAAKASATLGIGQLNRMKLSPIEEPETKSGLAAFREKFG